MTTKTRLAICLCCLPFLLDAASITVDFYGHPTPLDYHPALVADYEGDLSAEEGITTFCKALGERPYQSLLASLDKAKNQYQLNDWLYFKLMDKALDRICQHHTDRYQGVMEWFLLARSGYDARATYTDGEFHVNARTMERVFDSPMYEDGGKRFANLSTLLRAQAFSPRVYIVEYTPNPDGKDFSFRLDPLPRLQPNSSPMLWIFNFKGQEIKISGEIDYAFVDMMREYPKFDEMEYIRTPFSRMARESVLPQIQQATRGMTEQERMEFLVAFTRSGLNYGEDRDNFGGSRPLTAEEALFYPSVDCEDKVAVIYNLVKELTDLPAVVVAMPGHLSFGVRLPATVGKSIWHKGQEYTICDPTGPSNSHQIGIFPHEQHLRQGEILGELR